MLSIIFSPMFLLGVIALLIVWLVLITYIVAKDKKFYQKFVSGAENKNLIGVLEKLEEGLLKNQEELKLLSKTCQDDKIKAREYIQKVGLIRFNPFSDTGGQQSFVVSLLDETNSGVIFSHLFGRHGSRWFAKKVIKGKSQEVELTEEEQKAIKVVDDKREQI